MAGSTRWFVRSGAVCVATAALAVAWGCSKDRGAAGPLESAGVAADGSGTSPVDRIDPVEPVDPADPTHAGSTEPAQGTPEPVTVTLEGWPVSEERTDTHVFRTHDDPSGPCTVALDRWWGMPPDPGGPMGVASRRPVTVSGTETELLTTSAFQGVEDVVQVLFFRGAGYNARIVLRDCSAERTDEVLRAVRLDPSARPR